MTVSHSLAVANVYLGVKKKKLATSVQHLANGAIKEN